MKKLRFSMFACRVMPTLAICVLGGAASAQNEVKPDAAKPAPNAAPMTPYQKMLQTGSDVPLLVLDPSDKVWSLQITSGSQLVVRRGNLMVNSSHKGALWAAENGTSLQVDNGAIGVVGGTTILGNPILRPAPRTGFAPMADPFPQFEVDQQNLRVMSRQQINHQNGDLNLTPGIYEGGIWVTARNATVTMAPGTYVFRGGDFAVWNDSKLVGQGVTIVMMPGAKEAGSFNTQFGVQMQLSAPTEGPLQGLAVLSAAKGDKISFQATRGTIQGTIYGPQAGLKVSSESRVSVTRAVVANLSLVLQGALEITGADILGNGAAGAGNAAVAQPAVAQPAIAAQANGNNAWAKGQGVEINWGNKWWKGRILAVDEAIGKYRVHYDGWADNWDEWVTPDRLR